LNGAAHEFDEAVFFLVLAQLFFKLRSEQVEQFDVASNEWPAASEARKMIVLREAPPSGLQPKLRSSTRKFERCWTYST
jgi:hypothetical protein